MTTTVYQRVGPYEILEEIGRGGMAAVFLATDTRTNRRVALKLVPLGTDREAREILEAEEWGSKLQEQFSRVSSHVPAVYESGKVTGYFFIAMEYVAGENLSDTITRGPMGTARAVSVALDLCRFLEAAHNFEATIDGRRLRSLLHGDLKPRNVRIVNGDQIKVLDFGIAKALSLSRKVTRNDFGSIAYLSPERLESGEIDAFADVWAVGVLLYEMLSGVQPFQAPDTRRLEQHIRSRRSPPPLKDGCPPGVQAIVAKLLASNPTERYDSAKAIREDLERFVGGHATRALQEGWPRPAGDEAQTRRTWPPGPPGPPGPRDEEATRRTSKSADATAASLDLTREVGPPATTMPPVPTAARRPLFSFRAALLIAAFVIVINEVWVGTAAGRIASSVPTYELDQLEQVWTQYDALARRGWMRLGVIGLERALTQHTVDLTDRVIANYRSPLPTVREAQWTLARQELARASAAAPSDKAIKGALRYCDGHLHRINGEARKARHQPGAQQEFTESVTAFREAAELRPGWPDPFLGLVRTFIYGLDDVDRGADALRQAQRLGYTPGDRETTQLADGYRERADTLSRTARKLGGAPQEREYLTRAAESYQQALTLYEKAIGFADVATNLRRAQRSLKQIEQRLTDLSAPVRLDEPAQHDVAPRPVIPKSTGEARSWP